MAVHRYQVRHSQGQYAALESQRVSTQQFLVTMGADEWLTIITWCVILKVFMLHFRRVSICERLLGENAIAGFSFAGLMFPCGELPVRLICRPDFCLWKIACVGLPVTNYQTFKFPLVFLPVTAISWW